MAARVFELLEGLAQRDIWFRVCSALSATDLCQSAALGPCFRRAVEVEGQLWQQLCHKHYPTMVASVLCGGQVCGRGTSTPAEPRGKRGGIRRGSNEDRSRTPWWRSQEARAARRGRRQAADEPAMPLEHLVIEQATAFELASEAAEQEVLEIEDDKEEVPEIEAVGKELPEIPNVSETAVDWRSLYLRRWQRQCDWNTRRRCGSGSGGDAAADSGSPTSAKKVTAQEAARQRLKLCTFCGERYSPGDARQDPRSCVFHPGSFEPSQTRGWKVSELKQLTHFARQALRSAGGAARIRQQPRGRHSQWAHGMGILAADKDKYRKCLMGEVHSRWTCCDMDLFGEGCQRGMHRHF